MGLFFGQMPEVIACQQTGMGEQGGQTAELAKCYPRGRESTPGLFQEAAAAIYHPGPCGPNVGSCLHKREADAKKVFGEYGIGVEKEDVFALCLGEGQVTGPAKTKVFGLGEECYRGEFWLEIFYGVILRMIVHDNDLGPSHSFDALQGFFHGEKALFKEIFYLIADYYDG
jgi:hypothetical protein